MKHRTPALVVFLVLFSLPLINSGFVANPLLVRGSFLSSESWNQTGNASLILDTPEWEQTGNASIKLQTPVSPAEFNLSFSETLDDDVLYYPDPLKHKASYGYAGNATGAYTDTFVDDSSAFETIEDQQSYQYLYFTVTEPISTGTLYFGLDWRGQRLLGSTSPTFYWKVYNWDTSTFETIYSILSIDTGEEFRVEEIEYSPSYMHSNSTIRFLLYSQASPFENLNTQIDYAFLELATNESYVESFTEKSEWTALAGYAGTISTDNDVATITETTDTYCRMEYTFASSQDFENMYLEYRITASATAEYRVNLYGGDWFFGNAYSNDLGTFKYIIQDGIGGASFNASAVEKIVLIVLGDGGVLGIDYLRISKSNESGWQHDCSTTAGLAQGSMNSLTSDGTKIIANATGIQAFYMHIDTTSTKAGIDTSQYPFIEYTVSSVNDDNSDGYVYLLRAYDTDSNFQNIADYSDDVGTFRFNLESLTSLTKDLSILRWYVKTDESMTIENVKIYNIANWTATVSGSCTGDDYLYVADNGTLVSTVTTGDITLDYDPTITLDAQTRSWNKTLSSGTSYLSFYTSAWSDYSSTLLGRLYGNVSITDARLFFNESASIDVITFYTGSSWLEAGTAIIYLDTPNWSTIVSAIIGLFVPIDDDVIQWYLSLLGLALLPLSTMILVKGGREELSADKFILFLIIFGIGCALLIGGIT